MALSTAKALAFATSCKLIGVSTLDVIAAQQRYWRGPVCAIMEAGREEVYAAVYRSAVYHDASGGGVADIQRVGEYLLLGPQQLAESLKERVAADSQGEEEAILFCGEMGL